MTTARSGPATLLLVATVSSTIRHFLSPIAVRMSALGWHVAAAAEGADGDPDLARVFDSVHEMPWSRSMRHAGGMCKGERAVECLLDDLRPDIVHVHTPIASFITRLAARRMPAGRRPAVIYTAHGFHFHEGGQPIANMAFVTAERVAGRWTDRLVVINDEDEAAARRHHLVRAGRVVRMPGIGIDTAAFAPAGAVAAVSGVRRRLGIPANAPMFVIVGELNTNKRQADAIDALAALDDRTAHLVVVGEGQLRPRLEALAAARHVAARVHLTGHVGDVRGILVGATALVSTSAREGLSRSIMEALALGLPVVASDARGNRELVADSGIVVRTGDVAAISGGMARLLADPDGARAMGRRGRERMVSGYDLGIVIDRHVDLYRSVLGERQAAR